MCISLHCICMDRTSPMEYPYLKPGELIFPVEYITSEGPNSNCGGHLSGAYDWCMEGVAIDQHGHMHGASRPAILEQYIVSSNESVDGVISPTKVL